MRVSGAILIVVLLALLALPSAVANVVVFDRYSTTATVMDDGIHIQREVRIKNVGATPIIPGELHFRLYETRGGEKTPLDVEGFSAVSVRDEPLTTKVTDREGETDLSVHLWNPLLPGFHYDFTLQYDLKFEPSGVLFYEIRLPQEETTIPIAHEETFFRLDDKYHVTYAPGGSVSSLSGNTIVEWDTPDSARVVEYSRLPLPRIPVRAVNVFWIVIIAALIAAFVMSVRRQRGARGTSQGSQRQYQQPPTQAWNGGYQQAPPQQPPRYGGGR